jgi:iron complex transport system substrate-binding protein
MWVKRQIGLLALFLLVMSAFSPGVRGQDSTRIVHELGEVVVKKNPKTVVVFDYAALDILAYLGIEPTGVAKSSLPDYLAHFRDETYADVGTLFEPNFERIYALQPDVIFVSTRQAEVYPELARIAPTVYLAIDPRDYWGSFAHNVRVIGRIFGKEAALEEELSALAHAVAQVREKAAASGYRTLVLMANDGTLSVYGPGSRFGIVHSEFGFVAADTRIAAANHGQNVSFEYLLQVNPEVILVIDRAATVGGSVSAQQVLDNALVKMTAAAQTDRIFYLTSQVWYTAAGGLKATRIMVDDVLRVFD